MKKIKEPTLKITNDLLTAAFVKLNECSLDELILNPIEDGQALKIYYQEQAYMVTSYDWLYQGVMDMITDSTSAQHLNVYIWLKATYGGCLNTSDFYVNIVDMLEHMDQATVLNMALSISSHAKDKEKVFWLTLLSLDRTGEVFGKAIVASARTFHIERLAEEILDWRLSCGIDEYNQIEGGIFESVTLPVADDEDIDFYIFTVAE